VTIENASHIKAYNIYPPKDNHKWAVICEHIIRHYTEGWADGFKYDIKYWEIWNEPDNYEDVMENHMWRGTKEEYYELYNVASKHLKKCFPHLHIAGYASYGFYALKDTFVKNANSSPRMQYFIEFFDGFLEYIKKNGCPLDFFSWHSYDGIENNRIYASYARERLDCAGYRETETTCNEWNCNTDLKGTSKHAALIAAMMAVFQSSPLDSAMFYDAQCTASNYASLFNPMTKTPFPAYYAFKAFGELYKLGEEVELTLDEENVYAIAAKKDGSASLLISNPTDKAVPLDLCADGTVTKCFITAEGKNEEECPLPEALPENSFLLVNFEL
jgi:hypothetical protein